MYLQNTSATLVLRICPGNKEISKAFIFKIHYGLQNSEINVALPLGFLKHFLQCIDKIE